MKVPVYRPSLLPRTFHRDNGTLRRNLVASLSERQPENATPFSRRSPMKKLMLGIIALAAWPGGALLAQDLTGTWQGTLSANNRDLRTVIKISKADGNALKAVLYSIDQGGQGLAGAATLQGQGVKITIPGIGGTYEGKLNTDGKSIT